MLVFKKTPQKQNVNENNQGNNGRNSHQTVSINNDKHVANIDSNNGWNSWNSVWDYGNGFISTRILSKKACIIAKINEKVMPDVVELPQLIKEKMKAGSRGPPPVELRFTVSETRVSDLALYGKSVEAMCRGIPTYVAREARDNFFFYSGQCFKTNIMDVMTFNYCGETASFK
ncbi:gastrokine-1-like [Caretta caretta]|uniref:gastrokine-1-like n=1 Tax=Caretta caretta TaxID=8467 RepID=UPI003F4BE49C